MGLLGLRRPFIVRDHRLSAKELAAALMPLSEGESLTFDAHDRRAGQTWRETWTRRGRAFWCEGISAIDSDQHFVPAILEDVEDALELFDRWLRW